MKPGKKHYGGGAIVTGRPPSGDGLSLQRRLLSEYHPALSLSKYVSYHQLKDIIKKIESTTERKRTALLNDPTKNLKEEHFREIAAALEADEELQKLHESFFDLFQRDFQNVHSYLKEADNAAWRKVLQLKSVTQDKMKVLGPRFLVELYDSLQNLVDYRELNAACFGKALRKYSDRCAYESLLAMRRVRYCDDKVSQSHVVSAPFDISEKVDLIASVYGTVFGATYEESVKVLKQMRHRIFLENRERLVPMGKAYYYNRHAATKKAKQGSFARKVLAGSTSKHISKYVGQLLSADPLPANLGTFANGEVAVTVQEAVRGDDIFVIQSLVRTRNASLSTIIMELCLILQTLRLASAKRVTAVLPYLGYTGSPTTEVSAISEMISLMGCDHVITVDMFNEQVEGFFGIPVENVSSLYEFTNYIINQLRKEGHDFKNIVVVAPDSHTVGRARAFADALMRQGNLSGEQFIGVATAVRRSTPKAHAQPAASPPPATKVHYEDDPHFHRADCREFMHEIDITGDVKGKLCFIVDCVLDEGVNLHTIAELLKQGGAERIKAVATHALFSGDAVGRIIAAPIEELIVSDSIDQDHRLQLEPLAKKLRVLPLAPLIADAIERVHTENTLSTLFDIRR